jgi:hypothetical protein
MILDSTKNFAKSTLASGIAAGATSLSVGSGDGAKFPAPATEGSFNIVVWNKTDYSDPSDDPEKEIIRVTARSTDVMTITKAQEGTADSAHDTVGKTYGVMLAVTSKMINDINSWMDGLIKFSNLNAPEGFLINGKIVPTVDGSGNLTVAIKGMDGNNPSASNPVYCRIGGVVRTLTSALAIVAGTAGTNWLNAGSAELATKEIDFFVYLGWRASNSTVCLLMSRIPYANIHSDFNEVSALNEKSYIEVGGMATTDLVVNIGRFAATLSAGAGYIWTVPTFTASNLIQRPIYETRTLRMTPTIAGTGSMTVAVSTVDELCRYKIKGNSVEWHYGAILVRGGVASYGITFTLPLSASANGATGLNSSLGLFGGGGEHTNGLAGMSYIRISEPSRMTFRNAGADFSLATVHHRVSINYLIS